MMKWLKIILSMVGIVILFAIISAVLLVAFVSPNRFKPIITEQVVKATGRECVIDGDLSWSFFPYVGVKVGHMALSNPAGFAKTAFAEIDQATVSVKLLPLLHAQIESSGIALHGMKLHLIKNANGQTNWEDLQKKSSPTSLPVKKKSTQEDLIDEAPFVLAVSVVDITDASISWNDEQAKRTFDIDQFELHAKNISLNKAFPFAVAFNVSAKNPAISGNVSLSSQIILNVENQTYVLKNADLSTKINNIDSRVLGNINVNLAKDTLQLDDFSGQVANLTLTGKMNISSLIQQPHMSGHVQINPVDLKDFLQKIGQNTENLQEMKNVSGDLDFVIKMPSAINASGQFKIDALQTSQLKITDIRLDMRFQNNVLQLVPMTAKFYQGDLYSQIKVDLNGTVPDFSVTATLSNIQAEPLLQDLRGANQKITLRGVGNVDMQVTTSGDNAKTINRNLNGSGHLKFNNGVIEGIDIGYYIDSAYALAKKQETSANDTKKTTFGSLTGTMVIHDGVVSNNDLTFDSPRFDTTGKGTIDLVNQQIDYSLQTLVKKLSSTQKDDLLNLYGMAIPIRVSGNLSDPKVRLDTDVLLKALAQKQFQGVKEKVQDQLKDKMPELKGKANDLLNNLLGQ